MFSPLSHIAATFSFVLSSQLALPSISRIWVSKADDRSCSSAWHDHRADRSVPAKRKAGSGRPSSSSIQIVSFGP